MHHYFEAITNTSGDSLVGYFARVIDPATQNTIVLSSDDNGTPIEVVSGVDNMAKTDAFGNLDFYVVPGTYHLDIYAPNSTSFIMRVSNVAMSSSQGPQGDPGPQGGPGNGLTDTFTQSGTGAAERTGLAKLRESVSVVDYYQTGDTDDTQSFVRAQATGKRVFVPAGGGHGPSGVYLINFCPLVSGAYIYGEGAGSIIRPTVVANGNCFLANSGAATSFLDNITILDLVLYGRVEEGGFLEPEHLIRASGVRNLLVQDCTIKGFRGDGIYIGSGEVGGQERHNFNVRILGCTIDGITKDNRNGISVIDCVGIAIDKNTFRRCTRSNMPGPIDFEPDGLTFHVQSDITVTDNRFEDNGGNLGEIGFLFPTAVPLPSRITIRGNKFSGYTGTGAEIAFDMRRVVSGSDYSMAAVVDGNQGRNGRRPIDIISAIGVTVTDSNQFQDYSGPSLVGFTGATDAVRDIEFRGRYTRCGTTTAAGLLINQPTNLAVSTTLDTCGLASASGFPVQFGASSSSGVTLHNLRIVPAAGQTVAINSAGHTFSAATNKMINVDTGGLVSQFQAQTEGRFAIAGDAGWVVGAGTQGYRSGENRGTVDYNLDSGTVTSGTRVMILPVGLRPLSSVYFIALSGTSYCGLRADPDGSVFITPNAAPAASLRGQFTFNTGQ